MDPNKENSGKGKFPKRWRLGAIIFGVLLFTIIFYYSIQSFNRFKSNAMGFKYSTKSDMHHLFLACKAYWAETKASNFCDLKTSSSMPYGFVQSQENIIGGPFGTKSDFEAWAIHKSGDQAIAINAVGRNREIELKIINGAIEKLITTDAATPPLEK